MDLDLIITEIMNNRVSDEALEQYLVGDGIQVLRKQIEIKHKLEIMSIMDSANPLVRRLGVSLSKRIQNDSDIKEKLIEIWKDRTADFLLRFELIYRLLEINPNPSLIKSIDDFIRSNYPAFKEHVLSWEKGLENCMPSVMGKIDATPPEKAWLYLHELKWVKEKIQEIAEKYKNSDIPAVKNIAAELISE